MNPINGKEEDFTLISLKEKNVLINQEYANFKIGYGISFIYLSLINKEKKLYESIYNLTKLDHLISGMAYGITSAFYFLYRKIIINQFNLRYNKERTEVSCEFVDFNPITNSLEKTNFILNLKLNERDIFIFNNKDLIDLIEDFNDKYFCNLSAIDGLSVEITNRNISNEGFKKLCELNLKYHALILDGNNISDLTLLQNSDNIKFLEKLSLSKNQVNNINALFNLTFENLKELKLSKNKIQDISALDGVKMDRIEKLLLDNNGISDIKSFEKMELENLTVLNLSKNNIIKITPLENVALNNLKKLNLSNNNITDLSSFEIIELNSLEILNLSFNDTTEIYIKKKVFFPKLKHLLLNNNNIKEITIDGRLQLCNLYKINLMKNVIEKINIKKI